MAEHDVQAKHEPHRIVSVTKGSGCDYIFVWDDGYKATYSAAVQCGYTSDESVTVNIDPTGKHVMFPDGSSMSAELLRVDTMQKQNHTLMILLAFGMLMTAAMLGGLALELVAFEHVSPVYAAIACVTSLTALAANWRRCFAPIYLGIVLCMCGLIYVQTSLLWAGAFLAAGYIVQFVTITFHDYRVASGLES